MRKLSIIVVIGLAAALSMPVAAAQARPPSVKTLRPYGINDIEAILNCEVSPHGHEVEVRFEWGRTKRYGHLTERPEENPYPYAQHQESEEYIDDLAPNTYYHYRAVVSYEGMKVLGNDFRFKTLKPYGQR